MKHKYVSGTGILYAFSENCIYYFVGFYRIISNHALDHGSNQVFYARAQIFGSIRKKKRVVLSNSY